MRFLWTVARFDLGTLDRQQSWVTRTAQPAPHPVSAPACPVPQRQANGAEKAASQGPSSPSGGTGPSAGIRDGPRSQERCEGPRGQGGLRCQAAVGSSPHLAIRKSKKVVARAQKDTPQPTKESVLSNDSSSGPLCRRDRVPGVPSPRRHPDLTGPGSPAPRSNKAPKATALSQVKRGWQQHAQAGPGPHTAGT